MRYWKAGVIFLIAFLIQPSFLNLINIAGYTPNLLLCLTVIFTFLYDGEYYGPVLSLIHISRKRHTNRSFAILKKGTETIPPEKPAL